MNKKYSFISLWICVVFFTGVGITCILSSIHPDALIIIGSMCLWFSFLCLTGIWFQAAEYREKENNEN
jgi:hypothetical protein